MLHDPWFWAFIATYTTGYGVTVLLADGNIERLDRHHFIVMLAWAPIALGCFVFVWTREWLRTASNRKRRYTIWVNGRELGDIRPGRIKYETICALAGTSLEASVVWRTSSSDKRRPRPHGLLWRGRSVMLQDGMEFSAVVTGDA